MKRGRNYGIVYVTSATALEETGGMTSNDPTAYANIKEYNVAKKKSTAKRLISDIPEVELPDNLKSFGTNTDEIQEYVPKPETFEMEVQTQEFIDRPQTPLFTPIKEGVDEYTEIKEGDELKPSLSKDKINEMLNTRSGGTYIPPYKMAAYIESIRKKGDTKREEYQKICWDLLKKSLNGLINKVNNSNIQQIIFDKFFFKSMIMTFF